MVSSVVVGNGTTRKGKDLEFIKKKGLANLIACNWFFTEEFQPDILVTSDDDITEYIVENYGDLEGHHKSTIEVSSGATATEIAANESDNVFLIGMDFYGINGKVNNLYSGKLYYTPESWPDNTYITNQHIQQIVQIVEDSPEINFYHVDPLNGESPTCLIYLDNFHQLTYEEMIEWLK